MVCSSYPQFPINAIVGWFFFVFKSINCGNSLGFGVYSYPKLSIFVDTIDPRKRNPHLRQSTCII